MKKQGNELPISFLTQQIAKFIHERDWAKYHSPKNLSMSLAIEAAELMELFQWIDTKKSKSKSYLKSKHKEIKDEIADIGIYLLDLCKAIDIDFADSIINKLKQNARKYPARAVKGKTHKYTHYKRKVNG